MLKKIGQWLETTQFYCRFRKRKICYASVFLCDLYVWAISSFRNLRAKRMVMGKVAKSMESKWMGVWNRWVIRDGPSKIDQLMLVNAAELAEVEAAG